MRFQMVLNKPVKDLTTANAHNAVSLYRVFGRKRDRTSSNALVNGVTHNIMAEACQQLGIHGLKRGFLLLMFLLVCCEHSQRRIDC